MANAYQCDVCGKLFTRDCVPDITINQYHHGYGDMRYDLCPDCQKELEDWLSQRKGKNND